MSMIAKQLISWDEEDFHDTFEFRVFDAVLAIDMTGTRGAKDEQLKAGQKFPYAKVDLEDGLLYLYENEVEEDYHESPDLIVSWGVSLQN